MDVAFDTVGGETTQSLVPDGARGRRARDDRRRPARGGGAGAGSAGRAARHEPEPEQLARIAELVADGEVRVEIAEVMPLTEVQRAHELSESGHTRGKLVLAVAG